MTSAKQWEERLQMSANNPVKLERLFDELREASNGMESPYDDYTEVHAFEDGSYLLTNAFRECVGPDVNDMGPLQLRSAETREEPPSSAALLAQALELLGTSAVDGIVGGLPEQPEEMTVVCEGADELKVFQYKNGLFGIASAIDEYCYNERFHTREEALEWIAKGGEPTEMTQSFGDVLGEQGWPAFQNGQLAYWADDQPGWSKESCVVN